MSQRLNIASASSFGECCVFDDNRQDAAIRANILPLEQSQVAAVVSVIKRAMGAEEAIQAGETLEFHFACIRHGHDDGRNYFVALDAAEVVGITGLHHYVWGPPDLVWLGWLAVHPEHQGKGLGSRLLDFAEERARMAGYVKLFVETYSTPTFNRARAFYTARGFVRAGSIAGYLPDGDMVVFYKDLRQ